MDVGAGLYMYDVVSHCPVRELGSIGIYSCPMKQGRPLYFCPVVCSSSFLWPPCVADENIIFLPCGFFCLLLFFLLFFSPNLSRRRLDIYCTSTHGVDSLSANLKCRSETCCMRLAENTGHKKQRKICHLGAIAQLCRAIFSQLRHIFKSKKNLLSSNISSRCRHTMVNFCSLAAVIGPVVCDTPANFNGFHVLAAFYCMALQQWALAKLRR